MTKICKIFIFNKAPDESSLSDTFIHTNLQKKLEEPDSFILKVIVILKRQWISLCFRTNSNVHSNFISTLFDPLVNILHKWQDTHQGRQTFTPGIFNTYVTTELHYKNNYFVTSNLCLIGIYKVTETSHKEYSKKKLIQGYYSKNSEMCHLLTLYSVELLWQQLDFYFSYVWSILCQQGSGSRPQLFHFVFFFFFLFSLF